MKQFVLWYPSSVFVPTHVIAMPPVFIPAHHVHLLNASPDPGHRSVALFDQRHLDFAYQYPFEWNGTQFPVWYDFLLIDLDHNAEVHLPKLCQRFRRFDFMVYASGTEGHYHFIVPHNRITTKTMKNSYDAFLAPARIQYDNTVWSPLCGMAMPGCVHHTTGRKKTLLTVNRGDRFFIADPEVEAMLNFGIQFFGGEQ